jgi:3-(3-hydroxy-phenyl)propionate hydroxylase
MIGERAPWKPLWISIYNAKCLTLNDYRHGRVLFAGDAAHLVPIFGVRGLNSGLEDAANLAWKLARVLQRGADTSLLDTYTQERLHAARENMAYGAKSTEFMAPPNFAFRLMREATLRLALDDTAVRSLINPRQSAPITYANSPLNEVDDTEHLFPPTSAPGQPAPDARMRSGQGSAYLTEFLGQRHVLLCVGLPFDASDLASDDLQVLTILPAGCVAASATEFIDAHGEVARCYGSGKPGAFLLRPDAYVAGRWVSPTRAALQDAMARHVGIHRERATTDGACR